MKYKIALILPYFGKWPEWIDLFFYSCLKNKEIDFFIYTDCDKPKIIANAENIKYHKLSFKEYCAFVSNRLKISFYPEHTYKLCALKPFYGYLHKNELTGYAFWGFGDIDVVWGRIRHFYTDEILDGADVLSTHEDHVSGHLLLLRNNEKFCNLCFKIKNWEDRLTSEELCGLDESDFSDLLMPEMKLAQRMRMIFRRLTKWDKEWYVYIKIIKFIKLLTGYKKRYYFKEQFTTPVLFDNMTGRCDTDSEWIYKNGRVINEKTSKEIIYLHYMSYKKNIFFEDSCWDNNFCHLSDSFNYVHIGKKGIYSL